MFPRKMHHIKVNFVMIKASNTAPSSSLQSPSLTVDKNDSLKSIAASQNILHAYAFAL